MQKGVDLVTSYFSPKRSVKSSSLFLRKIQPSDVDGLTTNGLERSNLVVESARKRTIDV